MGSSSRPIDHGTNRVGRPNHHTTRIDANPPRYRTCDSHRIRLAQRLCHPSRAFLFHLSSPILDQTCVPQLQNDCAHSNGFRRCLLFLSEPCALKTVILCLLLKNYRAKASKLEFATEKLQVVEEPPAGWALPSFVYHMYRLASSRTKEAFWRARACADCRDYKPTPEATRFYSRWDWI